MWMVSGEHRLGVTVDGVAGPETFKAFQKWANKELGF